MKTRGMATILAITQGLAMAQSKQPAPAATRVQMVVTVEARHGNDVPAVARENVLVFQDRAGQKTARLPIVGWVPCQGDNAGMELFILIDDATNTSLGSQYQDIRDFVTSQPFNTAVGIAYMRNGMVDVVQPLTRDHAKILTKLRLPMESTGGNPYLSLSDLIRTWPIGSPRREVLMVTPGSTVFDLGGDSFRNIFVDAAIRDAQRAGVIVHAIYALGAGHSGHSLWSNLWAQTYLAQVAEETGGEAYSLGFGAPISLAPYLSSLTVRLANQYLLTFMATSGGVAGFQPVRIITETPNVEIISAPKFYVAKP